MVASAIALLLTASGPTTVSLEDAERLAVAHSTDVRLALNQSKSAWSHVSLVGSETRPKLSIGGSAYRFDDRTAVPFGLSKLETLSDHTEVATLELVQVIDISNQLGTAHAQARIAALASDLSVRSRISDQILATKVAYMNVLRAAQGVKVSQSTADAYREQLRTTTELWKQGTGQRIDVYRATSQVANAERDLVQRQNDFNMARSVLNDQLGLPLSNETNLVDVAPSSGETLPVRDITILTTHAMAQRSEAKSSALGVLAAQKGIKLARASSDPVLAFAITGTYYPTTSFAYPRQSVGTLALTLSIPIFDAGESRAKVEDARASLDIAQALDQQVQRSISLQVQNAQLELESARKSLVASEASLRAAVAARDLARQRFQNQVGLYMEVTDAQAALSGAQAAQVNSNYDVLIARARLQRATEDLLPPSSEKSKP